MAVLPLVTALHLAASCAPGVAPETLLSVVHAESRFDALAIGDNATHVAYHPANAAEAVVLASRLIAAGHSVDLGAAQINWSAGHLQRRGLSVASAFDPCTSFRIGGEVLAECYGRTSSADDQVRLRAAAGCYNTGSIERGAGYSARVWQAAARVVPAIRLASSDASAVAPDDAAAPEPRHRPDGMEDALHPSNPKPIDDDGFGDALHHLNHMETSQ